MVLSWTPTWSRSFFSFVNIGLQLVRSLNIIQITQALCVCIIHCIMHCDRFVKYYFNVPNIFVRNKMCYSRLIFYRCERESSRDNIDFCVLHLVDISPSKQQYMENLGRKSIVYEILILSNVSYKCIKYILSLRLK